MPEQTSESGAATPGRVLRSLQETAKADLPDLGVGRPRPTDPLDLDLSAPAPAPEASAAPAPADGEPTIEVEDHDGHVRKITARCSCGRTIDIHCDYDAAREEAPSSPSPSGEETP